MKEIFDNLGHITDYGLLKLYNNELEELKRLELAEHLSFCDECIEKYTTMLDSNNMLLPPKTLYVDTMKKIKKYAVKIICNKYFSAAVAAGIAILLWINGVFNINFEMIDKKVSGMESINEISITDQIFNSFTGVIDNMLKKH